MRIQWIPLMLAGAALPALFAQADRGKQTGKAKQARQPQSSIRPIPAGDWPLYSRDLASTRYSPLNQINTRNVSNLAPAWSYKLHSDATAAPPDASGVGRGGGKAKGKGGGGISSEATPIVVNGVMYAPSGNRVVALEADSGKEVWSFTAPGNVGNRAVGYWGGDQSNPPRVLFTTGDKMIALNATTGKVDPGFGNEGSVEIHGGWGGAPYVYKNLIVLGISNGESTDGPPGDTRTFDARTGATLWQFKTTPQPGEPGHETWLDDGWKKRAGLNVWGWYFTVDEARNVLYMPIGGPAGNYWGGDRPGANLYGNSVVAVDANTGKYKWHFQIVHHDLWDTDLPPGPALIDIRKDGQSIPALAAIGKSAWMFILDRNNGKPVFGVEERPVPKGDVPGEWYSPTQPFPLKPPALARTSFKKEDMVTAEDTTPEHAAQCQDLWNKAGGFYNAGPFTPFLFHEAGTPPKSTLQFPGNGGPNWGGMAADPSTGYVYVQTKDSALSGWIEKKVEGANYGSGNGSPQPYDRGSISGPGPYSGFSAMGMPCQKPPWGRLFAVNANTGDIAWETTLGLSERLPPEKQNTGNSGSAGPTVTAGGLVFIGATGDARFRAFDAKTGKELWAVKMEKNGNANPMVYQGTNGKEYVAIMATDTVNVYALP
ncbi:MAG TPA: PQQ-binding-like beta-propeller repeat protein [Bryobacteraceae bacterium]